MNEDEPPLRKRKKRSHATDINLETHWVKTSAVKTSLSSICNKGSLSDPRPLISDVLVYANQLRLLVGLVAKHHLFHLMALGTLDFDPNYNYLSRVKTIIVNSGLRAPLPSYEPSLRVSKDAVMRRFPQFGPYSGVLSKTCVTCIMCYVLKELASNIQVHVDNHMSDCLANWLNNQIRSRLTQEEFDNRQRHHIAEWRRNLETCSVALFRRHAELVAESKTLDSVHQRMSFMFRLRCDVDKLQASWPERAMKLFSVIPEPNVAVGPIRIDSRIMAHFYRTLNPRCEFPISDIERDASFWGTMFKLDKIKRLKPSAKFGLSIQTDGVYATVLMEKLEPLRTRPAKKKRFEFDRSALNVDQPGRLYCAKDNYTIGPGLVAIDPGMSRIVTAVSLDRPDDPIFKLSQGEYRDKSLLNYKLNKVGPKSEFYQNSIKPIYTIMAETSKKTMSGLDARLDALGRCWDDWWKAKSRQALRKLDFFVWRRREAFMDTTINRIRAVSSQPNDPTILFGDAGSGFGRLRGGGVKGPVLELRSRLARTTKVIVCDEYRTSKLCLTCGRPSRFYKHGVTYCCQQEHHRMENRDVAAARKIGARYLAERIGRDLGPWSRGNASEAPSNVLISTLVDYSNGDLFTNRDPSLHLG